ncbi:hypothetical protein [Pedococcus sp. 5OH_020]|uniref:hypothetical protein n=1 Tax=Pedococcus sp. 5OH_020 TaxID=2989814 RepID=UPI0022E9AE4C|nr:hypothetical protein [Pedococcus sp. 5OH_020]
MTTRRATRADIAHHHPRVRRVGCQGWAWLCACGGASGRTPLACSTWREAVLGALHHSENLAP